MLSGFLRNLKEQREKQKRKQYFLEFAQHCKAPSNKELFIQASMDSESNLLCGIERTQGEGVLAPLIKGELGKGNTRMRTSGMIIPFGDPNSGSLINLYIFHVFWRVISLVSGIPCSKGPLAFE